MHIVIIGGGIAGLYCAFELLKRKKDVQVTILEESLRLGGRIHTIHNNGLVYEGGAGRFSDDHKLLLKLIKELGLQKEMYVMEGDKVYIKNSTIMHDFDENKYIFALSDAASKVSVQSLKSKTLLMFMREVLPPSEVDDVIYAFGYQSEFETGNAYHSLQALKKNFLATVPHYGIKGGLSLVVDTLVNTLKSSDRCNILTGWKVNDVNLDRMTAKGVFRGKQASIHADRFVFSTTKHDLMNIPGIYLKDKHLRETLDTVSSRPLYRIYAKFPVDNGRSWFHDLPRICTNNALRHIIPINSSLGLIMLSYTDGLWAETWKGYKTQPQLQSELMSHTRKLFPNKHIPDPKWIHAIYWPNAAHYPKPYYKSYNQGNPKYLVCGEVITSEYNAWIEGALRSVHKALSKMR